MSSLPVAAVLPELLSALQHAPQVLLNAPTGAGKSTWLPLQILAEGNIAGRIILLEPRRLAARNVAQRLAELLGEKPGETVGFRMRAETCVGPQTRLEVVTEGILTRMIQRDPELTGVGLVILDEFHERSLQADLALALLLDVQQGLRDDLKLLIMSATLDNDRPQRLLPEAPVVARAALHQWEEPPISGTRGSGTVFFSGCSLGCVFCQNDAISHQDFGRPISLERLRAICFELIDQGAHNINLVNPTHYAHAVARLLARPLPVPVVWNSGGYDRVDTLRGLEGKIQIYLPDLKYVTPEYAEQYSGAADYPEAAQAAILEMFRQTGPCVYQDGLLKQGVIIRHLLLPGKLAEAKRVMDWVAEHFAPGAVAFSLMSQYLPWGRAAEFPALNRRLRPSEVRSAEDYMDALGLEGFTQGAEAARSEYIPAFDLTGV